MAKEKNIPELRFKGFEGEWEINEIKKIADRYDNLRVPITATDRKPGNTPYYGANGIQDYVEGYTHEGEYILVAEDGANDFKDYPVQYVNGKIWVNNHTHVLQGKANIIDNKFLRFAISQTDIEPFLVGGGRAKLNAETMMKIEIVVSRIFEEQTQIGTYFQNLDSLISLQQSKYNKLLTMKKAMLEKMFPKEGADVPEIRFKGFVGKWEKKKLGDIVFNLYSGQTPYRANCDFWNGDVNWLTSGELNRAVVTKTIEKITAAGQDSANLRVVKKDTFVMAITGLEAAGTRGNCAILGIDTTMNQSCMAIYPDHKLLDTLFLFQWYRRNSEEYGVKYTQGTKQQSYNAEILKKLEIVIPSMQEQKKISSLLQQLDMLISEQQKQLEKLKNIKKACLEKMFV